MRYAAIVDRLANEGARAWEVHGRAMQHRREGRDVVILSIGDPDFETPEAITKAMVERVSSGDTHYGSIDGGPELKAAIAAYHKRQTSHDVGAENISVTLGAQGGLYGAAMCVAQYGDEIIVPQPVYVTYDSVVQACGATLVDVPLRPERDFHLDAGDIEAAVTPRTRAVMINTPHNPTGAAYGRDDLMALGEVCKRHDLWLISDEVYSRTLFDGREHVSPASLPGMAERTIVVDSLSKSHAMTGWRVGWTVGPAAFTRHMYYLGLALHYGPPTFIQSSVAVAFTENFPEVEEMRARYEARRNLVCEALAACERVRVIKPEGSCFMMIDVRPSGLTSQEFSSRLLDEAGVSLLPGEGFGSNGSGFVRLSLTASDEELSEASRRIARFAGTLNLPARSITALRRAPDTFQDHVKDASSPCIRRDLRSR
ncbi:MAG: aminotransferase class I/II-fold pyridoxal phosphate-dependent enzyme [Rhodospirillaceae bacterium]|nr:aminotransferase class I/II-fold pyridoxal phosphate-dependent enzyme [Rhodospirillaceae bacterium]